MELLKKLTEAFGPSGYEDEIREIVKAELTPLCDKVWENRMGSVIGFKKGCGKEGERKKIMLAAHIDEIGFVVNHIDKKTGFLKFVPVGGFNPISLNCQRVMVLGRDRYRLIGTFNLTESESNNSSKPPALSDYYIDLGLPGKEVAKKVEIGDPVVWLRDYTEMGDCINVKALDDRIGVYVMLEAIRKVTGNTHDIYAVGTSQEEVGVRGAITSAFEIMPDIGIAIDVTFANDVPGVEPHKEITKLGGGVSIGLKDGGIISDRELVKEFRALAEKKKIKYQLETPVADGATDAAAIQKTGPGVRVINIMIPTRYLHSVNEMVNKNDVHAAIELLAAYLSR